VAALCVGNAAAGTIPVGYVSWDVNFPGNAGQFDITNLSGPVNSAPPTFPITTLVNLSSLSLTVDFVGGGTTVFGSSYFSLAIDGESFNGTAIPIGGTNPEPIDATLTGTFSPTSINDPGPDTILPSFSVTFSDTPFLVDGDLGVIYATEGSAPPPPPPGVPEPGTWLMLATGLAGAAVMKGRKGKNMKSLFKPATSAVLGGLLCLVAAQSSFASTLPGVTLAAATSPSSGVAGVNNVNLTASNIPSGPVNPLNVKATFASTCGGAAIMTESSNSLRDILGSIYRVNINIPTGLATGNYFVTIADTTGGDAEFVTATGSCSEVQVTGSTAILNACLAGSSLGVLLPPGGAAGTVTAYVPQGWWGAGNAGVFVKNIEVNTSVPFASVATANIPNSCASNPVTGQTVCVANNTDVYLLSGTTLNNTLTSGASGSGEFSGGECANCGVALNANNNTAVINMGVSGAPSGTGVQVLNLNNNTFSTPFGMTDEVSENISVDPTRSLILTAGEDGNYTLLQLQPGGSLKEFDATFSSGGENDSSAEDCSTGIAISPLEFSTSSIQLVNLNAITFGSTTYSAPNTVTALNTNYSFSAGPCGSAVAQGSGHLAVVTGEFGGNTFAVLKLPAAASSATPALVDYAVAQIPASSACGGTFFAGFDPHTVTAYTSPNTGDSMAVFAGYSGNVPTCLAVVDMTTVINPTLSPRGGAGFQANDIAPANLPASAVSFYALH
jgi:hypothetical protein